MRVPYPSPPFGEGWETTNLEPPVPSRQLSINYRQQPNALIENWLGAPPRLVLTNTELVWSQSCRRLNHSDEKSPFRPCGREVVEFFDSTGWARVAHNCLLLAIVGLRGLHYLCATRSLSLPPFPHRSFHHIYLLPPISAFSRASSPRPLREGSGTHADTLWCARVRICGHAGACAFANLRAGSCHHRKRDSIAQDFLLQARQANKWGAESAGPVLAKTVLRPQRVEP